MAISEKWNYSQSQSNNFAKYSSDTVLGSTESYWVVLGSIQNILKNHIHNVGVSVTDRWYSEICAFAALETFWRRPTLSAGHVNVDVDIMSYLRRHYHHPRFCLKTCQWQGSPLPGVSCWRNILKKIQQGIRNLKKFHGCFTAENGFMDTPAFLLSVELGTLLKASVSSNTSWRYKLVFCRRP